MVIPTVLSHDGGSTYHSKWNSLDTMILNLISRLKRLTAMFCTPTLECAMTHAGFPALSQYLRAAAIVDVFPVPGGPDREPNQLNPTCYSERDSP